MNAEFEFLIQSYGSILVSGTNSISWLSALMKMFIGLINELLNSDFHDASF